MVKEIIDWCWMLAVSGICGFFAYKKGYNFWAWFLGGTLISILIILFLPHEKNMAEDKKQKLINRGNTIGWCMFAASFAWGFAEGYFSK